MKQYIGITIEGIEDIAAEEVEGKVMGKGRILFTRLKENSRTINTVYQLEKTLEFEDIEEVIAAAKEISWKIIPPFRVTCRREGSHLFTANDIEKAVGEVIYNLGHPVNLKKPATTVFVDIVNNHCSLGILIHDALEKRAYRVRRDSTGSDACVAAALIRYANIQSQETMVDPFCRDGVLAIEAALAGIKEIYATDPADNSLRNAKINAKMAKVSINWEDKNAIPEADYIITHIKLSRREGITKKYLATWLENNAAKIKKEMTLLTNWKNIEAIVPKEFILEEKREISKGQQKNYMMKCKRSGAK